MLWPSGPLELARLENATTEEREALTVCHEPDALAFLKGSHVNCLVVSWAAGEGTDAVQQLSLKPLIAAAHALGLDVIGRVWGPPSRVKTSGLSAIISDAGHTASVPVLRATGPGDVSREATIAVVKDTVWPRVPVTRKGTAEGRPTGPPWVDANGWRALLAGTIAPNASIWLMAEPPRDTAVLAENYALAVADASAYGARWVIALDPAMRLRLSKKDKAAVEAWSKIESALTYFPNPSIAHPFLPQLGIISDYVGPNRFLAGEVLNLATRRQLAFRIIDGANMASASFEDLRAVLLVDRKPPDEALLKFAQSGGLLILPATAASAVASFPEAGIHDGAFKIHTVGKGRAAVALKTWSDPYVLAGDVHLLMSRSHDPYRIWNAVSTHVHVTGPMDSAVAHVLNYTGRVSGHPVSLWIKGGFRTAHWRAMGENEQQQTLALITKGDGVEVHLPPFAVCATIKFGV
jgi:hypothetical protein